MPDSHFGPCRRQDVEIPTKSDTISDLKSDTVSDLKPDIVPR